MEVKKIKNTNLKIMLKGNLAEKIKSKFNNCVDFVTRKLEDNNELKLEIMYFNNLVNIEVIDADILKPICMNIMGFKNYNDLDLFITKGLLYHTEIKKEANLDKICDKLYDGNFVIACPEFTYIFDVKKFEKRSIGDASTEASVKSAKDSFIEVAATNLSIVRRRIKSNDLKAEEFMAGNDAKTKVYIVYMSGKANKEVLDNIREKITRIDVSAIISPSVFEENLCERKNSLLPQIQYTERPDKFCACMVEGKIGIFVDGFPIGYIAPALFNMLMQDAEEYSISPIIASVKRTLRYIAIIISLTLSAFYVAIVTFHSEMLPTKLVTSIVRSKQDVPLQTYAEVMLMLVVFEMILEAGARLPKNIGQTISIIGGLIIGDAAVQAKFVSPAVIVIIAAVGISGFMIPNQDLSNAVRVCRLILVGFASIAGFLGISYGLILILLYLASYESFGYPYMKPFVAGNYNQMMEDTFIRGSLYKKKKTGW